MPLLQPSHHLMAEALAVDVVSRLKERLAHPESLEMTEHPASLADQDRMDKTLLHHLHHKKSTGALNARLRHQDLPADQDQRDQTDNPEDPAPILMVVNVDQEDQWDRQAKLANPDKRDKLDSLEKPEFCAKFLARTEDQDLLERQANLDSPDLMANLERRDDQDHLALPETVAHQDHLERAAVMANKEPKVTKAMLALAIIVHHQGQHPDIKPIVQEELYQLDVKKSIHNWTILGVSLLNGLLVTSTASDNNNCLSSFKAQLSINGIKPFYLVLKALKNDCLLVLIF